MPNMKVLLIAELGRSFRIFQMVLSLSLQASSEDFHWFGKGSIVTASSYKITTRDYDRPGIRKGSRWF